MLERGDTIRGIADKQNALKRPKRLTETEIAYAIDKFS
jgi:hypothetical protein